MSEFAEYRHAITGLVGSFPVAMAAEFPGILISVDEDPEPEAAVAPPVITAPPAVDPPFDSLITPPATEGVTP